MADEAEGARMRGVWTLPPRRFAAIGTAALLALIALVVSLDRWVGFDDAVWHAVLLARGCSTDVVVERGVELATRALAILLVVAVALHVRASGLRSVWPWIGTWVLGLLASKMLKHLLTRDRPSSLPDLAIGYSFPSAHVMNGVLAMSAVMALAHGFRHRGRWYLVAGALTAVLAGGRVFLGRHWATDVLGGGLSALVLVGFVVPAMVRRPLRAPAILAPAAILALIVDHRLGVGGVQLATPLVGHRAALVDVDIGPDLRPQLRGNWKEAGLERPFGAYLWLLGEATVPFEASAAVVASDSGLRLAFAGRPQKEARSCVALDVLLNGARIGRFLPFVGWREYRVAIPPGLLRAGSNEMTIVAASTDGPARFGVTYVRIAAAVSAAE